MDIDRLLVVIGLTTNLKIQPINNLYIFRVTPDKLKAAVAGVNVRKKVYVGWKHYNRNYFRAVNSAKGGRTRTITRKAGEIITWEVIEQENNSHWKMEKKFGMLDKIFEVCLPNSSRKEIEELTDNTYCMYKWQPCTFTDYLQANGMPCVLTYQKQGL